MEKAGQKKSNEVTITRVAVKKENFPDDIKEFAETTMNELLGWYGYENTRDDLKIKRMCRSSNNSNASSNVETSPKCPEGCGWCGKPTEENTGLASSNAIFCSELCFSQSRRANFKKNKTCDWCRHVRNTVSYVDFNDGASQLQFCSDKCLNQYKMHIFCRETRAHLELHPHLQVDNPTGTLITPELWLKNCKSPERSPTPPVSPKRFETPPQTSPLPLISVAHPSKLLEHGVAASVESKRNRLKAQKKTKKRLPATITCNNNNNILPPASDVPQDLRVRHHIPEAKIPPPPPPPPPPQRQQENNPNTLKKFLDNILPPPTVVVPYPIFLPLPIPVPIPIPVPMKKDLNEKKDVEIQTDEEQKPDLKSMGRLLRKRKRICEPKIASSVKTRRILSHTTAN